MNSNGSFVRDGVKIAYQRAGSGPLVVFLHGVGGNKSNWAEQLAALADRFCCVAWDARGYLDSDDADRELVFSDFADDLLALLDHFGVDRAHIVGLSMGGFIAQDFFELYPERVATLTLAATSAGGGTMSDGEKKVFLDLRLRPLKEGKNISDIAPAIVNVVSGANAGPTIRERLLQSTLALRKESYQQTLRAIVTTDFRTLLPRINVPTLVIVGSDDRVLVEAESRYLAENISRSRLVTIPNVGHLCNIEAPTEFNSALRDFLLTAGVDVGHVDSREHVQRV